jgi:hypothetical protein
MDTANTSNPPLTRSQAYYRANKERLNRERYAKYKAEVERKKEVKELMYRIESLYRGIDKSNFSFIMECPSLKAKYDDLIDEVREKYLVNLQNLNV